MKQKIVMLKSRTDLGFDLVSSDSSLQQLLEDGWNIKQMNSHLPIKSTSGVRGMASESSKEIIIVALLEKKD